MGIGDKNWMSHVWIKMGAWNKILKDVQKLEDLKDSDPSYRLFFKGVEVYSIQWQKAKNRNMNEWLGIWINIVGSMADSPSWDQDRGFGINCIARFDKWYMDEAYIRGQLKDLEVRKVNVVKNF